MVDRRMTVTVDDQHLASIDEVAAELRRLGMSVHRVHRRTGIIIGSAPAERRAALGGVAGVASITDGRDLGIAPPESGTRVSRDIAAHGLAGLGVHVRAARGFAALTGGDFRLAAEHLDAARELAEKGGLAGPTVVPFGGDLVEAHLRAGHRAAAREALDWLSATGSATGLVYPLAAAARCRGLLADDPDVIGDCFEEASRQHERCPMPLELARTALCTAEALRRVRGPAVVRPHLRAAQSIFGGLGARPWAAQADRQLAASGVPAAGPGANHPFDRLTPQELQIARAVAEGLSNPEAAARLYLSPKTIESHLTRIYRTLGLRSRTELARCFLRDQRSLTVRSANAPASAAHPSSTSN